MGKYKEDLNGTRTSMRSTAADNYFPLLGMEKETKPKHWYKVFLLLFLLILALGCLSAVIVTLVRYQPYVDPDGEDFNMFSLVNKEILKDRMIFQLKNKLHNDMQNSFPCANVSIGEL